MSGLVKRLRGLAKAPGVPRARHLAERSVAPYVRDQVSRLGVDHGLTVERLGSLEIKVDGILGQLRDLEGRIQGLERHMPPVLNAISSANGEARLLARRFAEVESQVGSLAASGADGLATVTNRVETIAGQLGEVWERLDHVGDDFRPHIGTIAFLLQRVETVRAEVMHELRYGPEPAGGAPEPRVLNPAALADGDLRVNLGAGHLPMTGYVNVDMRELPGIDVVAGVDRLPFGTESLTELFSSHTLEHFPEEQLRRTLLPYWTGLLRRGGRFRAVVPDLDAMTRALVAGEIPFDAYRAVAYGGQEYEGDFHFTGFTPDSLAALLTDAGLTGVELVASGRVNGDCLEFEMVATKP